ncbi:DNA-directed RNA polymerase sigma-70 factor [Planctomycetia bacterium]|nr:DNA-directed RNA polymerase sigma-70 factor [Planctomycetia bacterium]
MDFDRLIEREERLRRDVLAGDERAWRVWYDESFGELNRYVGWRCGGRADLREEVLQEVWLTAVSRIGDFRPAQGSFLNWLRGIAANVVRSQWRKQGRWSRMTTASDVRPPEPTAPEALLEDHERPLRVAVALAALSERHEAVLRAKYLDGLAVQEIADQWRETPKAIESLLSRARKAFADEYTRLAGLSITDDSLCEGLIHE